ncbi:hypothetical protein R3W88_029762 [Solanum pinnatisectum]|uniref:Gag-pol polyprotein n=1 Tax=Solanum pinnatisectum TaxID=50273 RepID=A0AAV9K9S5_9SOLN|nr:hypothetical protein R3W88_029762 [Solanum pinnatisectum]
MLPRRAVRGRPARCNVEEQDLPNAPKVQPQGEVTNAEFREAIRMLSQAVTYQVGQQRGARQNEVDISRICEFLKMNPPSFTGSSTVEDPENFIEELKKVFEVMHVADTERVELDTYQLKNVARTWFDQWKEVLFGDMDISRLMVYVQHFEEEKLRDKEEFKNKQAKTGNDFGHLMPAPSVVGTTKVFVVRAPLVVSNKIAPRGATSGTSGGTNCLYSINSHQEQEDSPDVVTGMIQVFDFTVYDLLELGTSLSFVTPYVATNFVVIP